MPAAPSLAAPAGADFGLDAPAFYRIVLPIGCALWAAYLLLVQLLPAPVAAGGGVQALLSGLASAGSWLLLVAAAAFVSSRWGKPRTARAMIARLGLAGDEEILDLGCGRGLAGITAARRLTAGRVVGIDIWNEADLAGNSAERALANAAAEGVAPRFQVQSADARRLPFPAASFDAVVSMTVLHNIHGAGERRQALAEIARVLRPGGQAAIFDIKHTGEYAAFFRQQGWPLVRSGLIPLWLMPGRYLLARKPAPGRDEPALPPR